jgi:hypothetical protein
MASFFCPPRGICDLQVLAVGAPSRGFLLRGGVSDNCGYAISGAGDINGDGFSDIVVGAIYASPAGRSHAGKTYVVFGSNSSNAWGTGILDPASTSNGVRGFVLQGQTANDLSACAVSSAGDINGDGLADILIGAYGASKAFVVFGSKNTTAWSSGVLDLSTLMDGVHGFVLQGKLEDNRDALGWKVHHAGDINGDKFGDLLISAIAAGGNGLQAVGRTYVIFGTSSANAWGTGVVNVSTLNNGVRGFALQGEAESDFSGEALTSADINGDNLADIVIGARAYTGIAAGKTYVIFGSNRDWSTLFQNGVVEISSLMDGVRGFVLQGEAGDVSGKSLSNLGDVNGDNLADIAIGAPNAPNGSLVGKIYVVFGSNSCNAWGTGVLNLSSLTDGTRGFLLQGENANDRAGTSVSSAGDINNDGYKDIFISSYWKSYVVFGGSAVGGNGVRVLSTLDGNNGFSIHGEIGDSTYTSAVAFAGDINGDGRGDLLVGLASSGRFYAIFGLAGLLQTPTLVPTLAPGTFAPTGLPTVLPTYAPTVIPTHYPTFDPTFAPPFPLTRNLPTFAPTRAPTTSPTLVLQLSSATAARSLAIACLIAIFYATLCLL